MNGTFGPQCSIDFAMLKKKKGADVMNAPMKFLKESLRSILDDGLMPLFVVEVMAALFFFVFIVWLFYGIFTGAETGGGPML